MRLSWLHSISLSSAHHSSSEICCDYKFLEFVHHDAVECNHIFSCWDIRCWCVTCHSRSQISEAGFWGSALFRAAAAKRSNWNSIAYLMMEYPIVGVFENPWFLTPTHHDLFDSILEGSTASSACHHIQWTTWTKQSNWCIHTRSQETNTLEFGTGFLSFVHLWMHSTIFF